VTTPSPSSEKLYFNSPTFIFGLTNFNVTAPLVWIGNICASFPAFAAGNIVMGSTESSEVLCTPKEAIILCQKIGCLGLVAVSFTTDTPGYFMLINFRSHSRSELLVPLVQVGQSDSVIIRRVLTLAKAQSSANNTAVVMVNILSGDHNEWLAVYTSILFILGIRVLFTALSVIAVVASFYLLRAWLSARKRVEVSPVTIACLSLLLFTNLVRVVYFSIDPFFSASVFP